MARKTSGLFDSTEDTKKYGIRNSSTDNEYMSGRKTSGLFDNGTSKIERFTKSLNENFGDVEPGKENDNN